jgi:hypothetical protein
MFAVVMLKIYLLAEPMRRLFFCQNRRLPAILKKPPVQAVYAFFKQFSTDFLLNRYYLSSKCKKIDFNILQYITLDGIEIFPLVKSSH